MSAHAVVRWQRGQRIEPLVEAFHHILRHPSGIESREHIQGHFWRPQSDLQRRYFVKLSSVSPSTHFNHQYCMFSLHAYVHVGRKAASSSGLSHWCPRTALSKAPASCPATSRNAMDGAGILCPDSRHRGTSFFIRRLNEGGLRAQAAGEEGRVNWSTCM